MWPEGVGIDIGDHNSENIVYNVEVGPSRGEDHSREIIIVGVVQQMGVGSWRERAEQIGCHHRN